MLIIFEGDALPLNAFLLVLFLLKCEHMLIELLLKLLISVVDAELFKRVLRKYLESEDVQKADKGELRRVLVFLS